MPDFKKLLGSRRAIHIALFISRRVSPRWGYRIARFWANLLTWLRPRLYWSARANLSQVLGPDVTPEALHYAVWQMLDNAGRAYYDHFHAQGLGREEVVRAVEIAPEFWEGIEEVRRSGRGMVMISGHISNFDLAAMAIVAQGVHVQALSVSNPPRGFQLLNELRQEAGVEVTPISPTTIRQALRRLQEGGIVFTGVDYPAGPGREPLEFFGRSALLPTGHARLAAMAGAYLMAIGVFRQGTGRYTLRATPLTGPLGPQHKGDAALAVAGEFLRVLESWIREAPTHWAMFLPVWPELVQGRARPKT